MPRITSIEAQKRHPDRYSLFLDGEFWKGIHAETVVALKLKAGQEVAESNLEEIIRVEEARQAREYALKLLSYRSRSEAELYRRFLTKGFAQATIEETLAWLRGQKLVDDADFAARWVEHRRHTRPMGRAGLTWELRQKGIDRRLVENVLETYGGDPEREAALKAAQKALSRTSGDPIARRRKIAGLLQRRGFTWDLIQEVLESLLPEESPDAVDEGKGGQLRSGD